MEIPSTFPGNVDDLSVRCQNVRMGSRIKNKQSQFSIPQSVSIYNTSATKAVQFIIAYQIKSLGKTSLIKS